MREVTVYYAYDDTEFTDRDECIAYENKVLNFMKAIDECYSFLDVNKIKFDAPTTNYLADWFSWISRSVGKCKYIERKRELPDEVNQFVHYEFGYCIENGDFEGGLGLFQYDMLHCEWVKVNE